MIPEVEKPRVTEIQVRMDCNGCKQKIKKALYGINGIYDHYIDFPQQKLTIIGWADPEKIIKAIKKTRKTATICSHTEPTEPPPEGGPPAPESANPPPAEAAQPAEPPKDPPPPENPPPEITPSPPKDPPPPENPQPSGPKDAEEVHVIYHHPPDYGYRYSYPPTIHGYGGHGNSYPNGPVFRHEPPQPIHVTHSYNTYKPSPHVTEYEYVRPPPQHTHYSRPEPPQYTHYIRPEPPQYTHYVRPEPTQTTYYIRPEPPQYTHYVRPEPTRYTYYSRPEDYSETYHNGNSGNGNITSMFSDENPNACRIV